MYRGVVEGAPWAKEGTYLRKKVEQYQLDKVLSHGRIWRLAYDGMARDRTQPRMLNETSAQLVAHLSHPNGWWRDTAQQLLVLKQDKSVVPALQQMVRASPNLLARVHALWTLEGLGGLDAALIRTQLQDRDPVMRIQAIRASESLYKSGDSSFAKDYRTLTKDADADVVIQAMLTLNLFKVGDLSTVVQAAQSANPSRGVQEVGRRILQPAPSLTFGGRSGNLTLDQQAILRRGATIYNELCATCHGPDGRGMPIEGRPGAVMAPPLLTSGRVQGHRDYVIKTLLHGLSGPLDGRPYGDAMVPMGTNTDEWIAAVASYVRSGFGGTWAVEPSDVAKVRTATSNRNTPWTLAELEASLPRPLVTDAAWKVTASHNTADAVRGVNFAGWTSGAPQQAGMWFQIELPAPITLVEIQFGSPASGGPPPAGTYPRGYQVQVSMDGQAWSAPVARGERRAVQTLITMAPVTARFLRITQTAAVIDPPSAVWSIQALRLFEAPARSVPPR
jgi:mono/diheme cytochrome c family protein